MNRLYFLVAAFVLGGASPGMTGDEPKPPTDEELREAKVFDTIADMIDRRDKLVPKFAVVLQGECTTTGGERDVSAVPVICARVVDERRSFDLAAGYAVVQNFYENGSETVRIGQDYKARSFHELFVRKYSVRPAKDAKDDLAEWKQEHPDGYGHNPFDDYLMGGDSFFQPGFRSTEQYFLTQFKLDRTEIGLGDRLITHWKRFARGKLIQLVRIEFDPAQEMMPVRHSIEIVGMKHAFREVRLKWKKHGSTLVPRKIEVAIGSMSFPGQMDEYVFQCHWMIGDEVPDEIFDAEDHLAALMDHVGIAHSTVVNGEVVTANHLVPADLYEP